MYYIYIVTQNQGKVNKFILEKKKFFNRYIEKGLIYNIPVTFAHIIQKVYIDNSNINIHTIKIKK